MTLESLARTIAKARHGTDAMWANYMPSARAVAELLQEPDDLMLDAGAIAKDDGYFSHPRAMAGRIYRAMLRSLIAQPDGAQDGGE